MNGNGERITTPNPAKPAAPKNFKLLHDPLLTGKKEPKLFRFEGIVQGEVTSSVVVLDPRSRITALSKRLEPLDIPVPRCVAAPTLANVFVYIEKKFCLQANNRQGLCWRAASHRSHNQELERQRRQELPFRYASESGASVGRDCYLPSSGDEQAFRNRASDPPVLETDANMRGKVQQQVCYGKGNVTGCRGNQFHNSELISRRSSLYSMTRMAKNVANWLKTPLSRRRTRL